MGRCPGCLAIAYEYRLGKARLVPSVEKLDVPSGVLRYIEFYILDGLADVDFVSPLLFRPDSR
jgi:hypothetical protein